MNGHHVVDVTLPRRGGKYRVLFDGASPTRVETQVYNWGRPFWRALWESDVRKSPSSRVTCILRAAIHKMQQAQEAQR